MIVVHSVESSGQVNDAAAREHVHVHAAKKHAPLTLAPLVSPLLLFTQL